MKKKFDFGVNESFEKAKKLFGILKPAKKSKVLRKATPRAVAERLGSNPLESNKGQFTGISSIVEENLINPKFEELQPEIKEVEPSVKIEKPDIKHRGPMISKKIKIRSVVKAKPKIKSVRKAPIKLVREAPAPKLLKKKARKMRAGRPKARKIKVRKLVSSRIPKIEAKVTLKIPQEAHLTLEGPACTQRKCIPDSEFYWCFSRRARCHGKLGDQKETLEKCAGCHMRETPA